MRVPTVAAVAVPLEICEPSLSRKTLLSKLQEVSRVGGANFGKDTMGWYPKAATIFRWYN